MTWSYIIQFDRNKNMQAFRLVRARAYKGMVWYLKVCLLWLSAELPC